MPDYSMLPHATLMREPARLCWVIKPGEPPRLRDSLFRRLLIFAGLDASAMLTRQNNIRRHRGNAPVF